MNEPRAAAGMENASQTDAADRQTQTTSKAADVSENPFSTRHTRPGALPFLFRGGETAEALVERLRQQGWLGEIVGPHGSGKSALVAALVPAIERAGRQPLLVALRDGQRRLPLDLSREARRRTPTVLIVDGFEQLGGFRRLLLRRFCRRRGWGLLATAHASVGLPGLYCPAVDAELFERIVERLTAGCGNWPRGVDLRAPLARHGGNVREALFDLYDLYEQRRPAPHQGLT